MPRDATLIAGKPVQQPVRFRCPVPHPHHSAIAIFADNSNM